MGRITQFDDLPRVGRMPGNTMLREVVLQEYRIPFWIWCSHSYIENHPEIFCQIKKACHRPYMTDDIPHLLLYLAGIKSAAYCSSKNIISSDFNTSRKRMIGGVSDYDMVVSNK